MEFVYIIVIILGLIVGSFLNVFIYRYPKMLKLRWRNDCLEFLKLPEKEYAEKTPIAQKINLFIPRSFCPHCRHPIKPWHNIPIISYLILRGKCHDCHKKISILYPIIEALTAILSLIVIIRFGLTLEGISALVFTWGIIGLGFIDYQEQLLPDEPTFILLWLGLLCNVFYLFTTPSSAILGALSAYLFLWLIAKCYYLIRRKEGMGYGDFKMFAMLGAWLGLGMILNVLLVSVILALLTSVILLIIKKINQSMPIPFGPYLAVGGWLTLIGGPFLTHFIQKVINF